MKWGLVMEIEPAKDEMYIVNAYIKHLEETRDKLQNEISNYRIPERVNAFNVLQKALQQDKSYAWGWHSNIAVSFQDEGGEFVQSNLAAARFMKLAFDIDVTKFDEWRNIVGIQTELDGKK